MNELVTQYTSSTRAVYLSVVQRIIGSFFFLLPLLQRKSLVLRTKWQALVYEVYVCVRVCGPGITDDVFCILSPGFISAQLLLLLLLSAVVLLSWIAGVQYIMQHFLAQYSSSNRLGGDSSADYSTLNHGYSWYCCCCLLSEDIQYYTAIPGYSAAVEILCCIISYHTPRHWLSYHIKRDTG